MRGEHTLVKKVILCPKCGHENTVMIKTNTNLTEFMVRATCPSCGEVFTVDHSSVFRNSAGPKEDENKGVDDIEWGDSGIEPEDEGDTSVDVVNELFG